MPIPRLTMAWGWSMKSMALWAMTLRSFMGRGWMEEMGALTSPAISPPGSELDTFTPFRRGLRVKPRVRAA